MYTPSQKGWLLGGLWAVGFASCSKVEYLNSPRHPAQNPRLLSLRNNTLNYNCIDSMAYKVYSLVKGYWALWVVTDIVVIIIKP